MTTFEADLGTTDRAKLAAHLAESRRLMTAALEKVDRHMFGGRLADATIVTPVTEAASAIAAAAGQEGPFGCKLPSLTRQDHYVISGWLERSRDRAAGSWLGEGENDVADGVERIRLAWDKRFRVEGEPGDRAWLRSPDAYKRAAKPAAVTW